MMHQSPGESAARPASAWWKTEDWLALFIAAGLIGAVVAGWKVRLPSLAWSGMASLRDVFTAANAAALGSTSLAVIACSVMAIGVALGQRVLPVARGAGVVLLLAWLALLLAANTTIKSWGVEYVVFALGLGMLWRQVLPVPAWLESAIRAEFYIKVGVVILGAGILFPELLKAGVPGLVQAALVIPVVWQITFFLGRYLDVDDEFNVMIASAVSICGVSAAIAACGAIAGDRRKLSYVTSLVLLCAVPMMLLMPWCTRLLGLPEAVAGAWLGGTLDTTGSVLAATEMIGETASKTGAVVKLSQNVFIGFAALAISLWWTMRGGHARRDANRSGWGVLWERFPKFVLGFIAASLVFSFLLPLDKAKSLDKALKGLREIWFAAAFVCIGLDTRLGELFSLGRARPAIAFLGGQSVNVLWTLLLAWLLFSGLSAGG
jgi:uncharacterized membrane protein YadS